MLCHIPNVPYLVKCLQRYGSPALSILVYNLLQTMDQYYPTVSGAWEGLFLILGSYMEIILLQDPDAFRHSLTLPQIIF